MKPAASVFGGLGLLLFLPAGAGGAGPAPVEMTVVFSSAAEAGVRIRIPPGHPFAESAAFHALAPAPGAGWRRTPAPFRRGPDGAPVFEDRVQPDDAGWVRIAVPLPDTAPAPGTDPAFAVRLTPPPGYRIADAFPALAPRGSDGRVVGAEMPAPPSLLRFRLVPAEGMAIGVAAVVDGAVALLLLGLAAFGARRLLAPPPAAEPTSR